jgi:uncharacterized membrane protein (DUF485 family)
MPMSLTLSRLHAIDLHPNRQACFSTGFGSPAGFSDPPRRLPPRHARAIRKKFRRRLKIFIVLSLLIMTVQAFFMFLKVYEIPPEVYSEIARDLQATHGWRYGYVQRWHGAVLVKTANQAEAIPAGERIEDADITQAMARELELVPWKFAGELIFYLGLLAFVLFVPGWLAHRLSASGRLRRIIPMYMALWAAAWIVFLLPWLAVDYGASMFTTWEGPGALSYSGPYPRTTATPAETVSYRPLVEGGAFWPLMIGYGVSGLIFDSTLIPMGIALLVFGTLVHGAYGLLIGANCYLDERNRMLGAGRCR